MRLRHQRSTLELEKSMKSLLLATVALAAVGMATQASAADLAARPYTKAPAVAPGINWSGFYAGVMGGYAWGDDVKGGFGGGTVGYNWQAPGSMWVWGLEVDAAGASVKDSFTDFSLGFPVTAEDKIRAFGSVTGRVGVTAGAALFYAKGGYAWADNRVSFSVPGVINFEESKVHSGWTVGAGAEYMFAPNWSAKVEYMYADYGSERYFTALLPPGADLGLTTHSVKGGINYHFN
jgi:outer membrane immunogenic protein